MSELQNAVTIILGFPQSGKTSFAKKLSYKKKTVWLNYNYLDGFGLKEIDETTELIIVDDASIYLEVKRLITSPTLSIVRKGFAPKILPRPETIIISNSFKATQFSDIPHIRIETLVRLSNDNSQPTYYPKTTFLKRVKNLFITKNKS